MVLEGTKICLRLFAFFLKHTWTMWVHQRKFFGTNSIVLSSWNNYDAWIELPIEKTIIPAHSSKWKTDNELKIFIWLFILLIELLNVKIKIMSL